MLSPRLFKALADPSRIALLVRLAEAGGPRTVSDVARGSNVDLSVVSRHLAILREAGILQCVKRGKEVWCSVQSDALARILRNLADALEACCPPAAVAPGEAVLGRGQGPRKGEAAAPRRSPTSSHA